MNDLALVANGEFGSGEASMAVGKEAKRAMMLEYLGNPDTPWVDRQTLATEVLGYRKPQSLWNLFSGADLNEILQEALEIRRRRCATASAMVDQALLEKALSGNVQAMKLYYQRYEGWSERHIPDHNGNKLPQIITITKYRAEEQTGAGSGR